MTLEQLIETKLVERTSVDRPAALRALEQSEQYLEDASTAAISTDLAYHSAYLAAFKAIRAHMKAHGVKETSGGGGHFKLGEYAIDQIADEDTGAVAMFQEVRQLRNDIQYGTRSADSADLEEALRVARLLAQTVRTQLDAGP